MGCEEETLVDPEEPPSKVKLNIASVLTATHALGPGLRTAIWLQYCPFHCKNCYSPDWTLKKSAELIAPEELARRVTNFPNIEGLTISGGEPFAQPKGLFQFLKYCRYARPEWTIIVFTGFRLGNLLKFPAHYSIPELLGFVDVLIDGLYEDANNNNRGLRGSTNQVVHRLSPRLAGFDFENCDRINEVRIQKGTIHFAGVPDRTLSDIVRTVLPLYQDSGNVRS